MADNNTLRAIQAIREDQMADHEFDPMGSMLIGLMAAALSGAIIGAILGALSVVLYVTW